MASEAVAARSGGREAEKFCPAPLMRLNKVSQCKEDFEYLLAYLVFYNVRRASTEPAPSAESNRHTSYQNIDFGRLRRM